MGEPPNFSIRPLEAMVIGGDPAFTSTMKAALEQCHFRVVEASAAAKAKEILHKGTTWIDLVVIDSEGKGSDGERDFHAFREQCPWLSGIVISEHADGPEPKTFTVRPPAHLSRGFQLRDLRLALAQAFYP